MSRFGLWLDLFERARIFDIRARHREMRQQRELAEPFDMSDAEFVGTYRLSKPLVKDLILELQPLMRASRRAGDISLETKVFTALSFYACGSYQRGVGQNISHSMSQPSVSTVLKEVTMALNHISIRNKYIKFPQTVEERNKIKTEFYTAFGIPGVIGCIDGTHIALIRPADHEERYFNRKRYHSINTQIICDASMKIISVDASHPGSCHDAFIWNAHPVNSHLQDLTENHNESTWLLGDSGYPQRKWLMTPILNAVPGSPEELYTDMQVRARNVIERCFGVLKARWRCLLSHRVLHYDPHMVGLIINACVILHNIAIQAGLPLEELPTTDQEAEEAVRVPVSIESQAMGGGRIAPELVAGRAMRDILVRRLWQAHNR